VLTENVQTYVGRDQTSTFLKRLNHDLRFPFALDDGRRVPLEVLEDGSVETVVPLPRPPMVPAGRDMMWTQRSDGKWRGQVEVLGFGWVVGTCLVAMGAVALLTWWRKAGLS
jgi:hypothetical protein